MRKTAALRIEALGTPPERHAARVVAEMCGWLLPQQRHFTEALGAVMKSGRSSLGSPIAQGRFAERLRRAAGRTLLDVHLMPGKGGRFALYATTWLVVRPSLEPVRPGEALSAKPWLSAELVGLFGKPRDMRQSCVLVLSHHAMQRMAERANVRTPDDLLKRLGDIWRALIEEHPDKEVLDIKLSIGDCLAVCHRDEPGGAFVVLTVKPGAAS